MRRLLSVWTLAAAGLIATSGCEPPPVKTVSLRMQGTPPDALVTIDDQNVGALLVVQKRGVAMPPGRHRITVERRGYFPWDRLVEVHDGDAPIHLDVVLTAIPD